MKKYIYILVALVAVMVSACGQQENVITYDETAAQAAVGEYEGTWQEISSYTGDTTYATGRIRIETVGEESPYVCRITIVNDSADWNTRSGVANIAHAGAAGDLSFNNDGVNELGSSFVGRVYGDGRIIFSCALASKIVITPETGKPYKKNVIVAYSFDGNKNQIN